MIINVIYHKGFLKLTPMTAINTKVKNCISMKVKTAHIQKIFKILMIFINQNHKIH